MNQNHLDPGFTDYSKRVLYNTLDITNYLKEGSNAVGIELGNGWFNEQTPTVWNFDLAPWRKRPQLLCEIRITYNDGSTETIATDNTWKTNTGPLLFDNIHVGVIYDARLEQKGWSDINYKDKNWSNVILTDAPSEILESQKMALISSEEILEPIAVQQLNDTSLVFDMGINTAGVVELNIEGKEGMEVKLKHGEMVREDGSVDQRNIDMHLRPRNEKERIQTDTYILKGKGIETFSPAFTYHGFRYVQVSSNQPISAQNVYLKTIKLHSDVENIGSLKTSNHTLNSIFEICKNSYLSNLFSIPTDCPTREKNGWMADGFMVQEAGMLNYDSRNIYAKWVKDMIDAQQDSGNMPGIVPTSHHWDSNWAGPIWDAAIFIVPDLLYRYSGDLESIKKIYPSAKRYLKYLESQENENGIIDFGLGDWLFYKAETSTPFMVTAYYYYDNILMAKMARLLNNDKEAIAYEEKAEILKNRINDIFFDAKNISYANKTQLSDALPLYMDIAPEEFRPRLAKKLNDSLKNSNYFLDFGFIGSLIVPEVLSDYGYTDSVYKMVTKEEMPSWGYWIKEHHATSLFETWDIKRRIFDASLNHPSMGAIAAWMYTSLAGIKLDENETSFKEIIIKPTFIDDLDFVDASYDSQYGRIQVKWTKSDRDVQLEIKIPPTATAKLQLPHQSSNIKGGKHQFQFQL
ncbi:glycoside hydrolase family 78 protein [Zunongwangia sp. M21534]|uniref:alpha-L-rhamnosidase n=1 Tax=Zunongwangia pacifica TaxID=2911062 RepID=A0A9X1ZQK6_9FLAO|nr:glycoside hydrolase family 78 protein [Zunongwangia pacifica]